MPEFASIEITQQLLEQISKMQTLCIEHQFAQIHSFDSVQQWGADADNSEHRISEDRLVVTRDMFYYQGWPKHSDQPVETQAMDVNKLFDVVRQAQSDDSDVVTYLAVDQQALKSVVDKAIGPKEFEYVELDEDIVEAEALPRG